MAASILTWAISVAPVWFQTPGVGTEVLILHIKADLDSRLSQHPSLPPWHTLPPTLNFQPRNWAALPPRGSTLYNPGILDFSSSLSTCVLSLTLCMCQELISCPRACTVSGLPSLQSHLGASHFLSLENGYPSECEKNTKYSRSNFKEKTERHQRRKRV